VENPVEKAGEMWKTSVMMSCAAGFPLIFELQQPSAEASSFCFGGNFLFHVKQTEIDSIFLVFSTCMEYNSPVSNRTESKR
jgi:hypothetical protein